MGVPLGEHKMSEAKPVEEDNIMAHPIFQPLW